MNAQNVAVVLRNCQHCTTTRGFIGKQELNGGLSRTAQQGFHYNDTH